MENTIGPKVMNEDKEYVMNLFHMVVTNESPLGGMKRIYEFENSDSDKDSKKLSNTKHLVSPSNTNLLIYL
jgi:hypothetical protein